MIQKPPDITNLKQTLEALYEARSREHLENDPLSFCHRYASPADREISALIASSFAYGAVKVIKKSLARIFEAMGDSPSEFVDRFSPPRETRLFDGFKHRFNDSRDLCCLLWAIRMMRERSGSIEGFFTESASDATHEARMNGFSKTILSMDFSPVTGESILPGDSYLRFLFPSPSGGSACKRLCMFLRWVVRPDDGIDLGLWKSVSPSALVIPVDVHISRIAGFLGLTSRKAVDWKMACDITESLRQLDPADPVKYDFSICHLGISEGCDGKPGDGCSLCPIGHHCSINIG